MSAVPNSPAVTSPTVGPRPLQLLDSSVAAGPASPILSPRTSSSLGLSTPPPSARSFKAPNPRRQSSISYFSSDHVDLRSPMVSSRDKAAAKRTNSMGIWTVEGLNAGRGKGDRRSLGSLTKDATPPMSPGPAVDHGPLTLTEKHADLLQFIAQKESKCLELRSQLAVHESELADLKRKWERIVSRGMDRAYASPHTPSRSSAPNSASSAAVSSIIPTANAAIKEGVRLIAAGLDLSASEPSSPPAFSPPAVPISGIATVSRATMASAAAMRKAAKKHAATQSMSSVSTSSTSTSASQRLSQSSASSLMSALTQEDPVEDSSCTLEGKPILADALDISSPKLPNAHLRRRSKDSDSRPSPRSADGPTSQKLGKSPLSPASAGWMDSMSTSVGKKWEEIQRGDTCVCPLPHRVRVDFTISFL
ncbi:hypothetical protein PHLGIDRAFT_288456 [Phlebiopsis gigantea 11061_1 CR5-6]|uniref:Uncharacterized protein n=1 Tax=Phlebiopsis gigantea (strain 11061_1 CR5-6) TaxID=745531 RepID=A0A0C3S379_PHLG1|nr:hypothetical protein PHLGIDRAFT_288456 [Phlebiopsis gigantea 11061_1 CR5-6]